MTLRLIATCITTLIATFTIQTAFAGSGASGHAHQNTDHQNSQPQDKGHQDSHQDKGHHGSLAGEPGLESKVDRTIAIEATDAMRFVHNGVDIRPGETIKFTVTNSGNITHEFSVGTKNEHQKHGVMMQKMPNMKHGPGGPSITVLAGKTETLIWKFNHAENVELACNIPGHYDAGMHSKVKFSTL